MPAGSLSRVATLAALKGHQVEVRASGPQAHEAVEHLLTLAKRRFDETDERRPRTAARHRRAAQRGPLPASPGIAIGPVRRLTTVPRRSRPDRRVGEPAAEWRRIVEAVAAVRREIEHVRVLTAREVGADEASIFDAHLSLLADAEMLADVKARIGTGVGAVAAWAAVSPTSSASGPSCPTPTCASAPQTSARSATRCCAR